MICDAFVFRKISQVGFFDLEPVLGSALRRVAVLLLRCHVRPADPVFVLSLTLQMLQRVAFHLPGDLPWTPILPNPLLPRDAFPQKGEGEKHGGKLFLRRQNRYEKRGVIAKMTKMKHKININKMKQIQHNFFSMIWVTKKQNTKRSTSIIA